MHANDLFATITDQLIADIETGAAEPGACPGTTSPTPAHPPASTTAPTAA